MNAINALEDLTDEFSRSLSKLKDAVFDALALLRTLSKVMSPAVNQRLLQILTHMSNLEYVLLNSLLVL
jgi:hypothetical protein